jgi:hypothetical protein
MFRSTDFDTKNIIDLIDKTGCLNEEVKCTDPSPSASVPWLDDLSRAEK